MRELPTQSKRLSNGVDDKDPLKEETEKGVAAVDRALLILLAFGNDYPSLSLADIAERTGFYKSTILRLIQSLKRFNFIVRGEDGRYRIGSATWRLGILFERELRLEERLMPFLRDLADGTNESVAFWIPISGQAELKRLCLLRVESPYAVSHNFRVGTMVSLNAPDDRVLGTTGRVMRAFLPDSSPQYEDIRKTRVFSSYGERDPELLGVAAPVFGPHNDLVGALTLSAPTSRRDRAWAQSMKQIVLDTADRATQALGGTIPNFPSVFTVLR